MNTSIEVLSFAEWRPRYEEEQKASRTRTRRGAKGNSKSPKCAEAYNPEVEIPPDMPWFRMNKSDVDAKIRDIAEQILARMAHARAEDKELGFLANAATGASQVIATDAKAIAIVGQQAMGKSLLINALSHRRDLSKTSASGGACTASAIRYLYQPGATDLSEEYDATVQFMDDENLKEIIEEHGLRYHHFYYSNRLDDEYREEDERAAITAQEFFSLIHNASKDNKSGKNLERLLQAGNIRNGALVKENLAMAQQRIKECEANEERVIKFDLMSISDLMSKIEGFIAEHDEHPTIWPVVQYVNILMGSALLRNGLALIDLPGLGDLNLSRTAATNTIRRKAGFEIIVAKSDRVITEDVVHQQIKQSIKAHGAKNTILLLTKIDEYFIDQHSVENQIAKNPKFPFPFIKEQHEFVESGLDKIEQMDEEIPADDAEYIDFDAEAKALEAYGQYLLATAQCAFIQLRAEKIEQQMRNKFKKYDKDPIKVFSVSASMYLDWMKARQPQRPILTPEKTGIPNLRRFLLSLSAEGNWSTYQYHVFNKLPLFLDKVARIVDDDSKDDAYAVIRPSFLRLMNELKEIHHKAFNHFIANNIAPMWGSAKLKTRRLEKLTAIIRRWGEGCMWNTYNKGLRERGIVKKTKAAKYRGLPGFNWNEELSKELTTDMSTWKRKMNIAVAILVRELDNATQNACANVRRSISTSSLAPALKKIAIEEWDKRRQKVLAHADGLGYMLKDQITETWKYATTETDTRCMLTSLNTPAYNEIEQRPWENDWYHKQRNEMMAALTDPDNNGKTIVDRIETKLHDVAKKELEEVFASFLEQLIEELEPFDEHIGERLPPDYEITNVDKQIRTSLKAVLPELQEKVTALQEFFEQDGIDEAQYVPQESAAEDETNECQEVEHRIVNEPSAKKLKTEEENQDTSDLFITT